MSIIKPEISVNKGCPHRAVLSPLMWTSVVDDILQLEIKNLYN